MIIDGLRESYYNNSTNSIDTELDISEDVLESVLSVEEEWTKIIIENASLEAEALSKYGSVKPVQEAVWESIKNWIKKAWAKIKAFIGKFISKISIFNRNMIKYCINNKSKIQDGLGKIKDFKGYIFKGKSILDVGAAKIQEIGSKVVSSSFKESYLFEEDDPNNSGKEKNPPKEGGNTAEPTQSDDGFASGIDDKTGEGIGELVKDVKELFMSKDTSDITSEVKGMSYETLYNFFASEKENKGKIGMMGKATETTFNKLTGNINKDDKAAENKAAAIKKAVSAINVVVSAALKAFSKKSSQMAAIARAAVSASEVKNDSYNYSSTTESGLAWLNSIGIK